MVTLDVTPAEDTVTIITGTTGRDRLTGTSGDDVIDGLGGNDRLAGRAGDDVLDGGAGRDRLAGGSGDDALVGGTGSDRLYGGTGNDLLTGDAVGGARGTWDRDVFILGDATRSGNDTITDFDTNGFFGGFFGGEASYDLLVFNFGGRIWRLDSSLDMIAFTGFIETDGNLDTSALRDGRDLVFVFDRDADGLITDSVRLENVIGRDGLSDTLLDIVSVDNLDADDDVFVGDLSDGLDVSLSAPYAQGLSDSLNVGLPSDGDGQTALTAQAPEPGIPEPDLDI